MGILDGWRFCPRCAAPTEAGEENVACPSCGFVAWANSVPAVQALVEQDGRLLLARRALDPGRGLCDLPGGFLREGEHPLDGLRRELAEETGLRGGRWEPLGRFWTSPGFLDEEMHLYLAEDCEEGEPDTEDDEEIELVRWTRAEADARVGELEDAKTVAGLLLWLRARP